MATFLYDFGWQHPLLYQLLFFPQARISLHLWLFLFFKNFLEAVENPKPFLMYLHVSLGCVQCFIFEVLFVAAFPVRMRKWKKKMLG